MIEKEEIRLSSQDYRDLVDSRPSLSLRIFLYLVDCTFSIIIGAILIKIFIHEPVNHIRSNWTRLFAILLAYAPFFINFGYEFLFGKSISKVIFRYHLVEMNTYGSPSLNIRILKSSIKLLPFIFPVIAVLPEMGYMGIGLIISFALIAVFFFSYSKEDKLNKLDVLTNTCVIKDTFILPV